MEISEEGPTLVISDLDGPDVTYDIVYFNGLCETGVESISGAPVCRQPYKQEFNLVAIGGRIMKVVTSGGEETWDEGKAEMERVRRKQVRVREVGESGAGEEEGSGRRSGRWKGIMRGRRDS